MAIDGLTAINPVNGKEVPIWVSDYVLMSYGTGAIMAVPAHDERDWEFAKKFHLPIIQVVAKNGEEVDVNEAAFTDVATGVLINSDFLNGLEVKDAKEKMIKFLEEKGIGQAKTNYKLRDWVFSRQRYWGEPIPIVHCDKCGYVPIDESELPLLLPEVESYMPTDNGESPLAAMTDWVNTTCPCCGGPAKRETDTMPQWAGSSWYFLRYTDPHNDIFPEKDGKGTVLICANPVMTSFWHLFRYLPGLKNRTRDSMLDVCLLGCGGMMPLPYRYLTALLTRFNGSSLLIDCGEGTQIAMKEKGWSFKPIDVICFTHYHGDHISGLPGLLLTMGNADRREPLTMIGPKGLERVVNSLRVIAPELPFPVI